MSDDVMIYRRDGTEYKLQGPNPLREKSAKEWSEVSWEHYASFAPDVILPDKPSDVQISDSLNDDFGEEIRRKGVERELLKGANDTHSTKIETVFYYPIIKKNKWDMLYDESGDHDGMRYSNEPQRVMVRVMDSVIECEDNIWHSQINESPKIHCLFFIPSRDSFFGIDTVKKDGNIYRLAITQIISKK